MTETENSTTIFCKVTKIEKEDNLSDTNWAWSTYTANMLFGS